MSQLFTYGFFGEDVAQRNFLDKYLTHCYPDLFIEDEEFHWRIKARNKDQVDKLLPQALRQKLVMRLDVLFVGRDTDTSHEPTIHKLISAYEKTCQGHSGTVLMMPVQCIEYWLWYIKRWKIEPNQRQPLETFPRHDAKTAIYGERLSVEKQLENANKILNDFDAERLEQQSPSFKHFHHQVKFFITQSP